MRVEEELLVYLESMIPSQRKNRDRDKKIIAHYYGFGTTPWPTYKQLADEFNVGTRERVRQIINKYFKAKANPSELTIAFDIADRLKQVDLISSDSLIGELHAHGLVSAEQNIKGLLNLAQDIGVCKDHNLYDSNMRIASRTHISDSKRTYLVYKDALTKYKTYVKRARVLPGRLGVAKIKYLISDLRICEPLVIKNIKDILRNAPDTCVIEDNNIELYLYENSSNTLINNIEKVFSLVEAYDLDMLCSTQANALRRQSNKYEYPNANIIKKWIIESSMFEIADGVVRFVNDTSELTDIDKDVVDFLYDKDMVDYPTLRKHLESKGYRGPYIEKAIRTSPFVYVDKSMGIRNYTYKSIAHLGADTVKSNEKYKRYRNRLQILAEMGTDVSQASTRRREQDILREWLFHDDETGVCAICGKTYSVGALIAAHKKKRSICSDEVRTDPYIVFPLCSFGCDYLYEVNAITIRNGMIVEGIRPAQNTEDAEVVKRLVGRAIPDIWLRGPTAYFNKTSL